MSMRDPATGQFRKPTPGEKVTSHVSSLNKRHAATFAKVVDEIQRTGSGGMKISIMDDEVHAEAVSVQPETFRSPVGAGNRDAQGRFVRATPEQRVAAHVEKVNARHPDMTVRTFTHRYQNLNNANWKDQAAAEAFADLPKDDRDPLQASVIAAARKRDHEIRISRERLEARPQPIEYEDDRQVWPWVLACGFVVFILATAIWVMTH